VQGVICTEMTLESISDYLGRLAIGKTGKAFIVELDGNLIATSVNGRTMEVTTTNSDEGVVSTPLRLPAGRSDDPWIAASMGALESQYGSLGTIGDRVVEHVTIDGAPMRLVASRYTHERNLDWLVVTLVPDADFLAGVEASRTRGIVIGAAAALTTVALGVMLALFIVKPFLALVAHVKEVGDGQLEKRIHLDSNREMAQLSSAINEMVGHLQDRARLRHALNLAMDVQQSLLPENTPTLRGIDVAARAQYCDETGGDYYDFLDVAGVDDDSVVIALGDVMGHGVAAAMLMATARGMLRSYVRDHGSMGAMLSHVNSLLVTDTGGHRFMTMLLMVIDVRRRMIRWTSAGHDPPFHYDPRAGDFVDVGLHGGLPLGIMSDQQYDEATITGLCPGQVIVVTTDGLWEARNETGEQFGRERLRQAISELAHLEAATIEAKLYERLTRFCGTRPIDDDVTYIVIKLTEEMFRNDDIAASS
jgi:serine phosphatase RsbU (regulator of sigma subunit)